MARRVETFTATYGRDAGKTFVLSEMPADQAERWAIRALLALAGAGVDIPDGAADAGMAAFATLGLRALTALPEDKALPLLDEMMGCVKYQPDNPKIPPQDIGHGVNGLIEEVRTRFEIRMALLRLHVGFSPAGAVQPTG